MAVAPPLCVSFFRLLDCPPPAVNSKRNPLLVFFAKGFPPPPAYLFSDTSDPFLDVCGPFPSCCPEVASPGVFDLSLSPFHSSLPFLPSLFGRGGSRLLCSVDHGFSIPSTPLFFCDIFRALPPSRRSPRFPQPFFPLLSCWDGFQG